MRINKNILYLNLLALLVNAVFLLLSIFKVWPAILSIAIFIACLASCILFSAKANGLTFKKRDTFHSAPTERMIVVTRREDGSYN